MISELFKSAVATHGERIAIADHKRELTYQELERLSNRVANFITDELDSNYSPVVVYMDRSIEAIIQIIGIIKTGRSYVPIDKSYTIEHLDFILLDSGATVIISDESLKSTLPWCLSDKLLQHSNENPIAKCVNSDSPAYTMYTSGSTGKPKGVQIDHLGIQRLVLDANYIQCKPGECVAHCSSIGFDASTFEIWYPLLNGGKVYVIDKNDVFDFSRFEYQLLQGSVETLWLTVALFNSVVNQKPEALTSIKNLLIGGDALNINLVRQFIDSEYCRLEIFLNGYGPTENTTFTTTFDIFQLGPHHLSVPIGTAINGTDIVILDESGSYVNEGEVGELVVSGAGLARGYTCDIETEKKFFLNKGVRYYKTGDLARKLLCGNIEFIARKDNEIKVRGLRVNLSQIEEAISNIAEVATCYVRPHKRNNQEVLVAYVESAELLDSDEIIIRKQLTNTLPAYMIPERMVIVNKIPLTLNGKADFKALEDVASIKTSLLAFDCPIQQFIAREYFQLLPAVSNLISKEQYIQQGFFELGGNSLQIYSLLQAIRKEFSVTVTIANFLEHNNISSLAEYVKSAPKSDLHKININERREVIPISPAQKRMWFTEQLSKSASENLLVFGYRIDGSIDDYLLEQACRLLVENNDAMRTAFIQISGELFQQRVEPKLDFKIFDGCRWQSVYEQEIILPFNLEQGDLMRFRLIRLSSKQRVLLLISNHILLDGWSANLINRQIEEFYIRLEEGQKININNRPDYFHATQQMLAYRESPEFEKDLAYWVNYLSGCHTVAQLPCTNTDIEGGNQKAFDLSKNVIREYLPPDFSRKLIGAAQRNNVSLFSYLTYYFGKALSLYSALGEVVLAIPSANREQFDDVVGMFVNTIPIRMNFNEELTVSKLHKNILQCLNHSKAYLDEIKKTVTQQGIDSSISQLKLGIAMQNTGHDRAFKLGACDVSFMPMPIETPRFDLFVHCFIDEKQIRLEVEYDSQVIYPVFVKNVITLFKSLLAESVELEYYLSESSLVLSEQYQGRSVNLYNFEHRLNEILAKHASQVCVVNDGTISGELPNAGQIKYTYGQLAQDIRRMKSFLKDQGIGAGSRVGVYLHPSYEYIVTILSVILNRCSFVPLDVRYPESRLEFIIQDSDLSCSIGWASSVSSNDELIKMAEHSLELKSYSKFTSVAAEKEACLLYTSGTTGTPKGVEISIDSIIRLTQEPNFLQLETGDRFLMASSPAFDASLLEIFVPLLNGLSCAVVEREQLLDYALFEQQIEKHEINTAWLTVSLFNDIVASRPETLRRLNKLIIGGDALDVSSVRAFMGSEYCRLKNFVNGYGPTECTTFSTWFDIFKLKEARTNIPIGKPINDTFVYLLDKHQKLCSSGQVGEIAIGAPWLNPNYYNRSDLNQIKFIENPFYQVDNSRYLYLTGDLARYNEDNDIEYIGRKDKMVKVRGNRVELDGINRVLSEHEQVRQSVIDVVENNGKSIFAYVVKKDVNADDGWLCSALYAYLRSHLEPFEVPSVIVFIDEVPMTINGKVDFRKLPKEAKALDIEIVKPRNAMESAVHQVWKSSLNGLDFCITESFFNIGGHSLLIPKVINELHEITGKKLSFIGFLNHQSVAELSEYLENLEQTGTRYNLEKTDFDVYPATSQQLNLFFSHELAENKALYNIPAARIFPQVLDNKKLHEAIVSFCARERIFNFKFEFDDSEELVMRQAKSSNYAFKLLHVNNIEDAYYQCHLHAEIEFDLYDNELIRFYHIIIADTGKSILMVNLHHIIGDESSVNIIFKSVMALYWQQHNVTYEYDFLDCCFYIHQLSTEQRDDLLKSFWQEAFSGYQGLLKFTNKDRLVATDHLGVKESFILSSLLVNKIKKLAQILNASFFQVSLAIYQLAVSKLSGESDVVIGFPYSPRVEFGGSDVIGYLVDIIPTRTIVGDNKPSKEGLNQQIIANQRFINNRPNNQAIPFVPGINRVEHYAPLVQNVFSFHGESFAGEDGDNVDLNNSFSRFDTVFNLTLKGTHAVVDIENVIDLYPESIASTLFDAFIVAASDCVECIIR